MKLTGSLILKHYNRTVLPLFVKTDLSENGFKVSSLDGNSRCDSAGEEKKLTSYE